MPGFSKLIISLALSIILICAIYYFARRIRVNHPRYVFTVIYAFSFGVVSSGIFLSWAYLTGAIDNQGLYIADHGKTAQAIADFATNISGEINLIIVLFLLLILPQLLAYILSSPLGCAANIVLFRFGGTIALWLIIKAFAFVAGFLVIEGPVGFMLGWKSFTLNTVALTTFLPALIMAGMMFTLTVYMDVDDVMSAIHKVSNKRIRAYHAWSTRFSVK